MSQVFTPQDRPPRRRHRVSVGTPLADVAAVAHLLEQLPALWVEAHEIAYSPGGGSSAKGRLYDSDPTGELAVDEGREAMRASLSTAARAISEMANHAADAMTALRKIVSPSEAELPTRGTAQWTNDQARMAEERARRRARGG